jgi:hypothetical protein
MDPEERKDGAKKLYQKWYICKFCKYLIKVKTPSHYLELRLINLVPLHIL